MMSESSKRHSKLLSLIFILKCLSKASVIRISNSDLFIVFCKTFIRFEDKVKNH